MLRNIGRLIDDGRTVIIIPECNRIAVRRKIFFNWRSRSVGILYGGSDIDRVGSQKAKDHRAVGAYNGRVGQIDDPVVEAALVDRAIYPCIVDLRYDGPV